MTTETSTRRPTHRVYAVTKKHSKKGRWITIGAAWPHDDGKGFSLAIDALPLDQDCVFRSNVITDSG